MSRLFPSHHGSTHRPLVIAHRGASGVAPENTCAAISAAIDSGADMVEIDVQLTKDGHLIVFHDWTLARTIRCADFSRRELRTMRMCDLALEQVRRFDAGLWWSTQFAEEPVPTLEEVLGLCGKRTGLNIEVKPARLFPLAEGHARSHAGQPSKQTTRIAQELRGVLEAHPDANVLVSSFDHALLARLERAVPGLRLGVLATSRGIPAALTVARMLKAASLHVPCSSATHSLVETAHTAGLLVFAYTANRKGTMRRLMAVGVDGIFTNFPQRLRDLLTD